MADENNPSPELVEQIKKELRGEVSKRFAGVIVAGVSGVLLLAAVGAFTIFKDRIANGLGVLSEERVNQLITAAGTKGDKGDKGDTGPAGPKGDKGDTGPPGPMKEFADKFLALEKDVASLKTKGQPITTLLTERLNRAQKLVGEAGDISAQAKSAANRATTEAGNADRTVSELKKKLQDASEVVSLLKGVKDLGAFLANNTEFQKKIADLVISVPVGTVAAFDLERCPPGWAPFGAAAGRMIVGVGKGVGLKIRKLGDRGGEERNTLKPEEMPSHSHGVKDAYATRIGTPGGSGKAQCNSIEGSCKITHARQDAVETEVGGNKSHNNMPPYIALHFCKKCGSNQVVDGVTGQCVDKAKK